MDLNVTLVGVPGLQALTIDVGSITMTDNSETLARIDALGVQMSDLQASLEALQSAITAMVDGITADVANLRSLLDQALATETADQATIADLQAQANAAVQSITAATAAIQGVDADPSFPPQA